MEKVNPKENNPVAEPQQQSEKRKIVIVEVSDAIEEKARDAADSQLTESLEQQKGVRGFVNRIWKHGLFREYYRQKEIQKAKNQILGTTPGEENIYVTEGGERETHRAAMNTIVERFASEYEETIHAGAGEKRELLGNSEIENNIKSEIRGLINEFSGKDINDGEVVKSFHERKKVIFSAIRGAKREIIDKGILHADNLLEIVIEVQRAIGHGKKLEEIDLDFDIIVGRAKTGVRTEAQFNTVDRIVDRIQKSRLGAFLNEATVSTAVSVAYSLTAGTSHQIARSSLFSWGTFGATAALGAGIAGLREKKRLEEERRQHGREMAMNKTFEPERSPRRKEMEQFRYKTEGATALADALEQNLNQLKEGGGSKTELTQEQLSVILDNIAEIESRIKLSDTQRIDLISYSASTKVEQERSRLNFLRARAKADIRKIIAQNENLIPGGRTLNEHLSFLVDEKLKVLIEGDENNEGIKKQDKLFGRMRNKRVAGAVVRGLITGLVIGGAFQEASAFLRDNQDGFIEGLIRGQRDVAKETVHFTPLEYLHRYLAGDLPKADMSNIHEVVMGNAHIQLPEGVNILENPDGSFNLMRGEEIISEGITIDSQGALTDEAKAILAERGITSASTIEQITGTTTAEVSVRDYIEQNRDSLSEIRRMLWYNNDTPGVFDKNELGLHWGGIRGTGIDESGNYVYNVRRMLPDGSFHGEFSVNALEAAKEGDLKLLLTLSRDSQSIVFEVPIDENYNAIIDPKSEIGRLFFANNNGRAELLAQFAEVAEVVGKEDGVNQVRILATDVGRGIESVVAEVPDVKDIPIITIQPPADYKIDLPFFIPIPSRRPLEPTSDSKRPLENLDADSSKKEVSVLGEQQMKNLGADSSKKEVSVLGEQQTDNFYTSLRNELSRIDFWEFLKDETQERFITNLEGAINRAIENTKPGDSRDEMVRKVLSGLGVEYEITSDHIIKITNINGFIERLKVQQEKNKADSLSIEEVNRRMGLKANEAAYELAKIAERETINLPELSREDYAKFAIDNYLVIDDRQLRMAAWQRACKSPEEILNIRRTIKALLKDADKAFHAFSYEIKEKAGSSNEKGRLIEENIRIRRETERPNSWLFFGINRGTGKRNKETYKSYVSVRDLRKLTPERFVSLMKRLRDVGYNGDIKIFQDLAEQGVNLNDQIVMHGASEKDAKLALATAKEFFGEDLYEGSLGKDEIIDGVNYSYSQIIATQIKSEIKLKASQRSSG